MYTVQLKRVSVQVRLTLKHLSTHATLEGLNVTQAVQRRQVSCQAAFAFKDLRTDVTWERQYVTNGVQRFHVYSQVALLRKFPTAHVACMIGVGMLWS